MSPTPDVAETVSRSFSDWFYTNAPAAWITALIAVVTCIFVLWTRKKAQRIVVREIANSSLIRIWPGVRQKIKMTFEDRPIRTLGQIDANIFNEGSNVIQNPTFKLILPEESTILDTLVTPVDLGVKRTIHSNTVTITFPYLNPIREHKHLVELSMLVDGRTEPIYVTGSGEGWSVKHLSLATQREKRYISFFVVCILFSYLYGLSVEKMFGIGMSEVSWRAFLSSLPLVIILVVGLVWIIRSSRKA